ncbi:hypothetical protein Rhe02_63890 [Rhizocola hellebori]|uniref:Uncharacterized protein n=1 Tax=Rhizocola hellebori TaxID=1392758 RepID=A0A8J3VJD4_9ACTN|nr:hypothetical protein [Rhizocola hellebori]GIH08322.1 hypothetical protein Rhe02_63890 [Rhizocola hellebori]
MAGIFVMDDPALSERARRFLTGHSHRNPHLNESVIRSTAVILRGNEREPAPDEFIEAMVRFEQRYGGLFYRVIGGDGMRYGLGGEASCYHTSLGLAFGGIFDGDWTWRVNVLLDGSTAMRPGYWPDRIIDRSVNQRIEKHALLVEVRGWFHRTFQCATPSHVFPVANEEGLPPAVPEATGPAELWWADKDVAVQATLSSWPPEWDRWTVRYFARTLQQAADANPTVYRAMGHETIPAVWCILCSDVVAPGTTCLRRRH